MLTFLTDLRNCEQEDGEDDVEEVVEGQHHHQAVELHLVDREREREREREMPLSLLKGGCSSFRLSENRIDKESECTSSAQEAPTCVTPIYIFSESVKTLSE